MKTFDEWKEIANRIHNNKYEYVEITKCKNDISGIRAKMSEKMEILRRWTEKQIHYL